MNQKTYYGLTGTIFSLITLLHLSRILMGWEANIGGWDVPMWLSWLAVVIAGYLAYTGTVACYKNK
ncbi:MAG: hypothetical protein AAB890_02660 [Patescibacteria group bacterium]